ncbi:MAG: hypothetical protein ACK5Y6_03675 [Pseudomonadota bacterium]
MSSGMDMNGPSADKAQQASAGNEQLSMSGLSNFRKGITLGGELYSTGQLARRMFETNSYMKWSELVPAELSRDGIFAPEYMDTLSEGLLAHYLVVKGTTESSRELSSPDVQLYNGLHLRADEFADRALKAVLIALQEEHNKVFNRDSANIPEVEPLKIIQLGELLTLAGACIKELRNSTPLFEELRRV